MRVGKTRIRTDPLILPEPQPPLEVIVHGKSKKKHHKHKHHHSHHSTESSSSSSYSYQGNGTSNNLIGPTGPQGPQGLQGDTGLQGPQGDQGPQGSIGPTGQAGYASVQIITNLGTITPAIKVVGSDGSSAIVNGGIVSPSGTTASSFSAPWVSDNALVQDGQWWLSAIDSNNPEWIQYDFGVPLLLTGVYAVCANGRNGAGNKLQGSTDGNTWIDIHTFDGTKWTYIPDGNLSAYSNYVDIDTAYRYIRLYSDPSPYCCYDFIQYIGLK